MADNFGNTEPGLSSPASKHRAVTPSDSTILDPMPRAIVALTAGNVVIQDVLGTSILTGTSGPTLAIGSWPRRPQP